MKLSNEAGETCGTYQYKLAEFVLRLPQETVHLSISNVPAVVIESTDQASSRVVRLVKERQK